MNYLMLAFLCIGYATRVSMFGAVRPERVPEGILQPTLKAAKDGQIYLAGLFGDPKSSDILLFGKSAGHSDWTRFQRVNSQPGSAIAIGTIRGAQLAVGKDNSVHVLWNGSSIAEPKPVQGGSPLLYSRATSPTAHFSPQRNLMFDTQELDGGGAIVSDDSGRVDVIWHASSKGSHGETNRVVFRSRSTDDGANFAVPEIVSPADSGACGCCGLASWLDSSGMELILYRGARSNSLRGMNVIVGNPLSRGFELGVFHSWESMQCPLSTSDIQGDAKRQIAIWENGAAIYMSRLDNGIAAGAPIKLETGRSPKHPRIATNSKGETLVVWTEGTGWNKGGKVAWRQFDRNLKPTKEQGTRDDVPVWSFAGVYVENGTDFVVLY